MSSSFMKKIATLLIQLFLFTPVFAQVSKNLHLTTAGTLASSLTATEKSTITDLTLTGNMDGRDFLTIQNNLTALVRLDIGEVSILEYYSQVFSGGYSYTTYYPAKTIPLMPERLKFVILPKTATTIQSFALSHSGINSIIIPKSMKNIGGYAFQGCSTLSSVTIEDASVKIGDAAFNNCPVLTEVNLGDSVTSIGSSSFAACSSLEKIELPNTVSSVGDNAFQGCSHLKHIGISSSLKGISANMFTDCSNLENVTLPNSILQIGESAFKNCTALRRFDIPNSVTSIAYGVLYNCTGLKTLTIAPSVKYINSGAFANCTSLDSIYISAYSPSQLYADYNAFMNLDKSRCVLSVPFKSRPKYLIADQWKDFSHIIENNKGVSIDKSTYYISDENGDSVRIKISANDKWSVICDQNWVELNPGYGVNNGEIKINVKGNNSISGRKATITISDFQNIQQEITLIQYGHQIKINSTAGNFSNLISANDRASADNLKVTGEIDARDFRYIRDNMPLLTYLDLSEAKINAYSGNGGTRNYYSDNYPKDELPLIAFSAKLTTLKLPSSLNAINYDAFSGCIGLNNLFVNIRNPLTLEASTGNVFNYIDTTSCVLHVPFNSGILYAQAKYWKSFKNIVEYKDYLFLNAGSVLINPKNGNTSSVAVNANVSWTAESDQSWLSLNKSSGSGNDSISLVALPNTDLTSRSANVLFKSSMPENIYLHIVQTGRVISVANVAGGLNTAIPSDVKKELTNLVITGTMDARDFRILRDSLPNLTYLDLYATTILAYAGLEGTIYNNFSQTTYPANEIPVMAFYNSNTGKGKDCLKSIVFPQNLNSIASNALKYCIGLNEITLPACVTTFKDYAFEGCTGITSFTFPANLKTLGIGVFEDCSSLRNVTLNPALTNTGSSTFDGCTKLNNIIVPQSVTAIGESSFSNCTGLTNITLPGSVVNIGSEAFSNCTNLSAIQLPNSLISIGASAFYQCSALNSVNIPNSVKIIGDQAFKSCKGLASVTLSNSLASIGAEAFYQCSRINKIDLPKTLQTIGKEAFYYSGLTSIAIPDSVKIIESSTFSGCYSLTSVQLPGKLESIGFFAFNGCDKITSITIPNSVTTIGDDAFQSCRSLRSIYLHSTSPILLESDAQVFNDMDKSQCTLYVNYKTKPLYVKAIEWKDFPNIVENESGVFIEKNILFLAAKNGSNEKVSILSNLSWSVISDQPWLSVISSFEAGNESVTFTASENPISARRTAKVKITDAQGFSQLISVTQDAAVKSVVTTAGNLKTLLTADEQKYVCKLKISGMIDVRDFKMMRDNMPSLEELDIAGARIAEYYTWGEGTDEWRDFFTPYYAATIPTKAFQNKTSLKSIMLPVSLKKIEDEAFQYCDGLNSVVVPDSVTSIASDAFSPCKELVDIKIGKSVSSIGDFCFGFNYKVNSITCNSSIPANLNASSNVFYGIDKSMCTLYVPRGSKSLYESAKQWKDFLRIIEMGTETEVKNPVVNSIAIYPNPVIDYIYIKGLENASTMELFDINGKLYKTQQVNANVPIPVGFLARGIYVIRIHTSNDVIDRKFIKQ